MPTRPFRTNPARLIPTPREKFSTRHTETRNSPLPLSRCQRWPTEPYAPPAQTTLPPPSGPRATHANPLYTKPQAVRATARWAPPITPQSQAQVPLLPQLSYPHARGGGRNSPLLRAATIPPRRAPRLHRRRAAAIRSPPLSSAWRGVLSCGSTPPNFSDRVVVAVCRREESF
jgi:hypothetical protein